MLKEKQKLIRQERKLLSKISSWQIYKSFINIISKIFYLNKKFYVLEGNKYKKILGIISLTTFFIVKNKISYIDDFIVNKKSRGKGIGKKIFTNVLLKTKKDKNNYIFLLSRNDRKVSHKIYKNFGFQIISIGIGIIAYKKLMKK